VPLLHLGALLIVLAPEFLLSCLILAVGSLPRRLIAGPFHIFLALPHHLVLLSSLALLQEAPLLVLILSDRPLDRGLAAPVLKILALPLLEPLRRLGSRQEGPRPGGFRPEDVQISCQPDGLGRSIPELVFIQ
jgi:hypothetical protein